MPEQWTAAATSERGPLPLRARRASGRKRPSRRAARWLTHRRNQFGEQFQVIQIVEVEHLQVHPRCADAGVLGDFRGDLVRRASQSVLAKLVRLPADRRTPPLELGLGAFATHYLRVRED